MIFELLKTLIIGIVEGITEWLPISSTGHMILLEQIIPLKASAEYMEMFNVVIQLGAVLAVVVMFFPKLWPFTTPKAGLIKKDTWIMWFKVLVGALPAAIVGVPLDDKIDTMFYNAPTVAATLIIYGVLFIVMENWHKGKKSKIRSIKDMSFKTAFFIGLFQVLSLIPGTSRSGATILGAMFLGCSRTVSAEFSFFMAVPVMFGASLVKLVKFGMDFTAQEAITLAVGMITAFLVSMGAIHFLMDYVKRHNFKVFGYYRIVLGVIVMLYFLIFA